MITERCKKCVHCERFSNIKDDLVCMYTVHKMERRGCPTGDECTKFEERKRPKRKTFSLRGY